MAEVVFARRKDAKAAVKRYNNILLNGKHMKIEKVGTITTTSSVITPTNGTSGAPRRFVLIFLEFHVRNLISQVSVCTNIEESCWLAYEQ